MFDTAISHAMLREVAAGSLGDRFRLYVPDNVMLFSSLDARRPGYARAVELAREAGFEPVIRLAGGHAAVFLEQSMAFAWASFDPDARLHIKHRFETLTAWIVEALRDLGLDARVGEIPGEYCPGEYSVNLAGRVKVMGVGQRVIRGGAHVGGVVTVGQTSGLREVLVPIYEALELEFRPDTAGGLADTDPNLTPDCVIRAVVEVLVRDGHELVERAFEPAQLHAAEALTALHSPERKPGAAAALRPSFALHRGKTLVQDSEPTDAPKERRRTDSSQ